MSPTEAMIEPAPPSAAPSADTNSLANVPPPSTNGEDESALARLADDGAPPTLHAEIELASTPSLSLEERVRRLEDALALLQQRPAEPPLPPPPPVALTPPLERPPEAVVVPPPPPPLLPPPPSTAVLLDVGKRLLGAAAPLIPPVPVATPSVTHQPGERTGLLWLLWDTWAEARAILRMFVDPRYRLSLSARVLPLIVLAAILTSKYWIPGSSIPILGEWLLVKLVDLVLAFLLFKWLGHEARRYRQTSPDLPSSLRL